MAINKNKTLANGASGEYWKITMETYDRQTKLAIWEISLFKDKPHSDAGAPSIGLKKIYSSILSDEEAVGNRTALGYQKIITKSASMVNRTLNGHSNIVQFDPDLADGESV